MKMNLKFTATIVDEIEKSKGLPIENCISDNTISNLALIISKALVNDNGSTGVSRAVALSKIDEYLNESDKDNLLIDIMEALVESGFLSRALDVQNMRETLIKKASQMNDKLESM